MFMVRVLNHGMIFCPPVANSSQSMVTKSNMATSRPPSIRAFSISHGSPFKRSTAVKTMLHFCHRHHDAGAISRYNRRWYNIDFSCAGRRYNKPKFQFGKSRSSHDLRHPRSRWSIGMLNLSDALCSVLRKAQGSSPGEETKLFAYLWHYFFIHSLKIKKKVKNDEERTNLKSY